MKAPAIVRRGTGKYVELRAILLLCLLFPIPTRAQGTIDRKVQARTDGKETSTLSGAESPEAQRRALAISLVTSLADEARSYHDLALRPWVLARAADRLWEADREMARVIFRRAWEAAEMGDASDLTVKTKDNPPSMVMALRRMSGRDLRSEVLAIATRRDRTLGDEFLAKLKDEDERKAKDSKSDASTREPSDNWSSSEAAAKRLILAGKLLNDGQVERALEFAAPVLDRVNANSIGFLSALRARSPEVADRGFSFLMARVEVDPFADANTVSGLSSYAFTPGFYVIFRADGGATWREGDSVGTTPPKLPAPLLNRFFQVAAGILLRPSPPPDQDFTSAGRAGKYMAIKRLLPLFDLYAPDTASALRSQLTALTDPLSRAVGDDSALLIKGLQPEETAGTALEKMQGRIDHAKTARERDLIYAEVAVLLANQGVAGAQDLADKIEDSDRRTEVRRYVDFEFVQLAIKKNEASEVERLIKAGQLTHTQRAWAYTQTARFLVNSERPRSLQLLDEAAAEARNIDNHDPDRARSLIGVATQFLTADRVRAWEILGEAVKSANSADDFTGENLQVTFSVATKSGIKFTSIGGEDFGISGVLRSLTRDDFYRSLDLAKSFKNEAPRAAATLAIVRAVLDK